VARAELLGRVHDRAAVGEHRQQVLREEVGAFEDDTEEPVEQLLGGVLEHRHLTETGVVYQIVERCALPGVGQFGRHLLGEARERFTGADIERKRDRAAAAVLDGGDGLLRPLRVGVVGHDDPGAAFGDAGGRGLADT
jgi:hypothetical protein